MKRNTFIILTILSLLFPMQIKGSDFYKSLNVFNSSDFETALKEQTYLSDEADIAIQFN